MKKEYFIKKANAIHNNRYNYDKVPDEFNCRDKITIICPVHGDFLQTAHDHLSGRKCIKCKYEKLSHDFNYTTEEFIRRAKEVHGDKYDYSKVNYVNSKTKICIICHEKDENGVEHGEFWQEPTSHLMKRGCPKCKQEKLTCSGEKNGELFFKKCNEKFNYKYDYSKSYYHNSLTKILIKCPVHGEFWQIPKVHLSGCGCPKCAKEYNANILSLTTEEFIRRAKEVHGDKYDYSKVNYVNSETKVCIICPEHGEFWQSPGGHLAGYGCDKCAKDKLRGTTEEFIRRAKEVHGDKYDYSRVDYEHSKKPVEIVCKKHGSFFVTPFAHLHGCGCKECGAIMSTPEEEIYNYICSLIGKENVISHDRKILNGKEIDIYVPSKNIAIEHNGIYWHSEECGKGRYYHINKTRECSKKNIRLIQIFEDEYNNKKDIVLSKIKHILHCNNCEKIFARNSIVREITFDESKEFLEKNHIQGKAKSSVYLGAFYNNQLVSVMTLVKCSNDKYELNRFASDINYNCIGFCGKLFSYFIKKYNPCEVKSFADLRWSEDSERNLYTIIGFKKESILPPDYSYVKNDKRYHKFTCRKQILHKKYGLPLTMTENEMTKELGFNKIWNCGLIKYVWKK